MASMLLKADHRDAKSYVILSWTGTAKREGLFVHRQALNELYSYAVNSPSLALFNLGPADYHKKVVEGTRGE